MFCKTFKFPFRERKVILQEEGKCFCVTYKVYKGCIRSLMWCEHVTCDTWQWHSRHISLTQQPSDRYDDRELGKCLAVLCKRWGQQHFLSLGKVLSKTLAYITSSITQTFFTQSKGREAPVKKWRKYWERGLSWPCYYIVWGAECRGMSDARGKAGVSGRLIKLIQFICSCCSCPVSPSP